MCEDELAVHLDVPSSRGLPRLKKGQPITAWRVDEMEVRLPLVWKSHPVLIDPHPPPSLHSRLSPCVSPPRFPNIPFRTFPQLPSLLPSLCFPPSLPPSFLFFSSSLLIVLSLSSYSNVRPLSLRPRSSPSRSLPFLSPSPPPCQPREEIHFREKKGKKARKIDAPRRLAALGRARVCIRSRRAHGRGLKMSSRCVIAYIDPTLSGVYAAPTDATPTRGIHGCADLAVHPRTRDAFTGAIASVHGRGAHSIVAPACITCVGDVYGVARKRLDPVSINSSGLILMTLCVVVISIKFQIYITMLFVRELQILSSIEMFCIHLWSRKLDNSCIVQSIASIAWIYHNYLSFWTTFIEFLFS